MSKLKDLLNKGARLIVTDDEDARTPDAPKPVRELSADAFPSPPRKVIRSQVPADVADFGSVYKEAGVAVPPHGYGIDKVAEMLENKRLAPLARDVKATAVLAALEAAGVSIRDVIHDAVLRDNALDAFEAAKEKELQELKDQSDARISGLRQQIDAFLREKNGEIEGLKQAAESATQAFVQLQARKQSEEARLHSVVANFIEEGENPITTSKSPSPLRGAPPPPPRDPRKG